MRNREERNAKTILIDLSLVVISALAASRFFKLTDPFLASIPTVNIMGIDFSTYWIEAIILLPIWIGILFVLRYWIRKLLVRQ